MGIFAGLLLLAAMNMGKASTAEMEK